MRGFLRMELVDKLRRTHEPKNTNNLRVIDTVFSDQKVVVGRKSREFSVSQHSYF